MPSLIPYKRKSIDPIEKAKLFFENHRELLPSIVIVLIFFAVYAVVYFWEANLLSQLEDVQAENQELASSSSRRNLEDVEVFAARTRMVGAAIDEQHHASKIFSEFQATAHKQIVLRSFDLNVASAQLTVSGLTESFETLGQQFLLWKNDSLYITDVEISSFQRIPDSSRIDFSAKIKINPEYLN